MTDTSTNLLSEALTKPAYEPQARWRQKNPLAVWAQASLRSALNRGIITREPCRVCGAEESEAHHFASYHEPLTVQWLCRRHHKAAHAAEKAAQRAAA